jgi:hypothetical protein
MDNILFLYVEPASKIICTFQLHLGYVGSHKY